jgi:glycosyltransferase involved in cell wall biosynthesis
MTKHTILVFANLKPSQVNYKILPLSRSEQVEKVIILRKNFMEIHHEKVVCIPLPGLMKVRPFYWFVVAFYGIYLIKRYKVTLILNYNIFPHGFNAFFASLLTKKPVIFAEINEDTIHYHKHRLIRPLISSILSNAIFITVPGSSTEHYWNKNGFGNTVKLHSTINSELFIPDNSVKTIYDFLYIGEFDQNKRPDLILEAFIRLRKKGIKTTICFIGFGLLEQHLLARIKEVGLEDCAFLVKTNSVLKYIQQSKIFLMASLSEGIPCALMETMACGLIPIVTPAGDIADVIKHGVNGIIHDGSLDDFSGKMEEVLFNYLNLQQMRMNARKTIVESHSYEVATNSWNSLLKRIN